MCKAGSRDEILAINEAAHVIVLDDVNDFDFSETVLTGEHRSPSSPAGGDAGSPAGVAGPQAASRYSSGSGSSRGAPIGGSLAPGARCCSGSAGVSIGVGVGSVSGTGGGVSSSGGGGWMVMAQPLHRPCPRDLLDVPVGVAGEDEDLLVGVGGHRERSVARGWMAAGRPAKWAILR